MSQPQSKVQQLRIKYTNNCTLIGQMANQIEQLRRQTQTLVDENLKLDAEFAAINAAVEEAKVAAAKVEAPALESVK